MEVDSTRAAVAKKSLVWEAKRVSLLKKANPNATWQSVVCHALKVSLFGTCLFLLVLWSNSGWTDWPRKVGVCVVLLLFVGGLWEWQVPSDLLDEEGDEEGDANCQAEDSSQSR